MTLLTSLTPFLLPLLLGFSIGLVYLILKSPSENFFKHDFMKHESHNHVLNIIQTELDINKDITIKLINTGQFHLYIENMEFILFNTKKPLIINKFLISCNNIELAPGAIHEISIDIKPIYFEKKQSDIGLYDFLKSVKKFNLIIHKHNSYFTDLSFYLWSFLSKPFKK